MSKPHARSAARTRAFQVLYGIQFTPVSSETELRAAFRRIPDPSDADMDSEEGGKEAEPQGFAWELVEGVWKNEKQLDAAISALSRNWRVDRLGRVELTLLRLAMFEIQLGETPGKAVINEALALASKFANAQAGTFINGVLDAAIHAKDGHESK